MDIIDENFDTQFDFVETLSELNAIVILDEHGHAFSEMKARELGDEVFTFLYPEFYDINGKQTRVIFTGSNQESFETSLNSSYIFCRRHVQPMTDKEFQVLCTLNSYTNLSEEDIKYFCNNVPREVGVLAAYQGGQSYLTRRSQQLYENVAAKVSNLEDGKKQFVSEMLENLFLDHAFAIFAHTIPFFDIGLVYRRDVDGNLQTFPMCRPAEMALITLWKSVGPAHMKTVQECIDPSDGRGLEKLVVCKLLSDYVGNQRGLPSFQLLLQLSRIQILPKILIGMAFRWIGFALWTQELGWHHTARPVST